MKYFARFNYAKVEDVLHVIGQLLRAASLPPADHNQMVCNSAFSFLVKNRWLLFESRKGFSIVMNPSKFCFKKLVFWPYFWFSSFSYFFFVLWQIATIVHSRQDRLKFDYAGVKDLDEDIILEENGSKISPLVVNPGKIILTSLSLYFQPFNNIELVGLKCHSKKWFHRQICLIRIWIFFIDELRENTFKWYKIHL